MFSFCVTLATVNSAHNALIPCSEGGLARRGAPHKRHGPERVGWLSRLSPVSWVRAFVCFQTDADGGIGTETIEVRRYHPISEGFNEN